MNVPEYRDPHLKPVLTATLPRAFSVRKRGFGKSRLLTVKSFTFSVDNIYILLLLGWLW